MERVDIRLSKIKPLRILVPLAIAIPVLVYTVYFTDKFANNKYIKYWIPILGIWGVFESYKIVIGLVENKPVIKLTRDFLETYQKGESKKYKWTEIDVTIGKDNRNVSCKLPSPVSAEILCSRFNQLKSDVKIFSHLIERTLYFFVN